MEMKNLPGKCEIGKCVIFWLPTSCKRFWQKLWNSNSACSSYTKNAGNLLYIFVRASAFNALCCLLVGWPERHPACKKQWLGTGVVIFLERGADLHMAQLMPLSLASVKSRLVLPFWYRLTRLVPDKGPLNGCVCVLPTSWEKLSPSIMKI